MVKLEKDYLRIASKLVIIPMPNFYIYIQIINSYLFSFSQRFDEAKISEFHLPGKKTKLILQQTFGYEVINNSFTFGKNLLM